MQLIDFISLSKLETLLEAEKAKLICYYQYKENGKSQFSMMDINKFMINSGFNSPNLSRLRDNLIKGKSKSFLLIKGKKGSLEFIPAVMQRLEQEFGDSWNDTVTIISSSEFIDEKKFCGKRGFLDRIIRQINHTYSHNCYDACAVLMRRLFEILLVLSYQNLGIEEEIKDSSNSGYIMLEGIVKNAINNSTLKLSRIKNEFEKFRVIGNFSAHNITYTAGKKDIDDIKIVYRVMLEELFNKAGLIK
jgi:hypothetical protein